MLFEPCHAEHRHQPFDTGSATSSGNVASSSHGAEPASAWDQAISLVGAVDADALSPDGIASGLAAMVRLRSAIDAAEARLIAEADRRGAECIDVERMLRNTRCSVPAAKRSVRRARMLKAMPRTTEALAAGEITAEHADALVRAAEFAGADAVDGSERLLGVAVSSNPERTRRIAADWVRARGEGLSVDERHERQRRLRTLTFGCTEEGMLRATVLMDAAGGAALRAVIDDAAQRLFEADRADRRADAPERRSYGQCRVDALEALLGLDMHRAAQRWIDEDPHRIWDRVSADWKGPRPADLPALAPAHQCALPDARHGELGFRDADPLPAAVPDPSGGMRRRNQILIVADLRAAMGDEAASIEIADSGPLPLRVFERLACGADIYGALFDGPGSPLWHGRRVRTVTDAQWRALVARDRRCVLCDLGPQWCEAHHVIPWQKPTRGPTDIDNLALLCFRCHGELHDTSAPLRRGPHNSWYRDYTPQRE